MLLSGPVVLVTIQGHAPNRPRNVLQEEVELNQSSHGGGEWIVGWQSSTQQLAPFNLYWTTNDGDFPFYLRLASFSTCQM